MNSKYLSSLILTLISIAVMAAQEDLCDRLVRYRWVSDWEKNISWISTHRPNIKDRMLLAREEIDGFVALFDGKNFTIKRANSEVVRHYEVIGVCGNTCVIKINDPIREEDCLVLLGVDDSFSMIWVYDSNLDVRQYYANGGEIK